jgi:hypothetical protein
MRGYLTLNFILVVGVSSLGESSPGISPVVVMCRYPSLQPEISNDSHGSEEGALSSV